MISSDGGDATTASPLRWPGGALRALREANLGRVLEVISTEDGLSQAEVARRTGLCRATVSNLVAEMRRRGLVRGDTARAGGRASLEVIIARAGVVAGVENGRRHMRVAVADLGGRILAEEEQPLPVDVGTRESCAQARAMTIRLLERTGVPASDVLQVGVGLPHPVDAVAGRPLEGRPAPSPWALLDPRDALEKAFQLPVVVDGHCSLGALGELRQGAGRGCSDMIYLHAGERICAGLVLNGRVHRGAAGAAGDIGHMTVDPHGQICRCGNRGCLETVAGATSFLAQLRAGYGPDLEIEEVIQLAGRGDLRCHRALSEAGRAVGMVIADLCNLLGPQRVIVAGAIFGAGETILGPLRETVRQRAVPAGAPPVEIVESPLDRRATLVGAICLALDAVRRRTARGALGLPDSGAGSGGTDANLSLRARTARSPAALS